MRRVLIGFIGLVLVFVGCIKHWEEEWTGYTAPNWTSDNKIIFMRNHYIQKWEKNTLLGATNQVGGHQDIYVCEIEVGGSNFREVCKIVDEDFERGWNHVPISTSSAGDYIVISKEDWTKGEHYTEMFIMKRDGTGLRNLGEGSWPDLSPDGKKIVYQKPNQGLWIMNIDGSGDRQIVAEGSHPAQSSEGRRIAYIDSTFSVMDTIGNLLTTTTIVIDIPDWGPADSNAVVGNHWPSGKSVIIYLDSLSHITRVDTLPFVAGWGAGIKWSPSGDNFIGHDENGYFVIKRDGTDKRYLKP